MGLEPHVMDAQATCDLNHSLCTAMLRAYEEVSRNQSGATRPTVKRYNSLWQPRTPNPETLYKVAFNEGLYRRILLDGWKANLGSRQLISTVLRALPHYFKHPLEYYYITQGFLPRQPWNLQAPRCREDEWSGRAHNCFPYQYRLAACMPPLKPCDWPTGISCIELRGEAHGTAHIKRLCYQTSILSPHFAYKPAQAPA